MSDEPWIYQTRALGALLGVHAGDSLGSTVEFKTYEEIKAVYPDGVRDMLGRGVFNWRIGQATDDTDLTRAVLLAYRDRAEAAKKISPKAARKAASKPADKTSSAASEPFDVVVAAAEWSLKWLNGDWPERTKGSTPKDIGHATMVGLKQFEKHRDVKNCGAGPDQAGNGSLMRCIPTALFTPTQEERIKESMGISAFTHDDVRCTISCAVYNEIVAALVQGKTPEEAVAVGIEVATELDCPAVVECIKRGQAGSGQAWSIAKFASEGPGDSLPMWSSGYVLQSFSLAIAALLDKRSLEDILIDVVRLGGDTDTNGAIAGGLLGARDGYHMIPERWTRVLQFREEFATICSRLFEDESVFGGGWQKQMSASKG